VKQYSYSLQTCSFKYTQDRTEQNGRSYTLHCTMAHPSQHFPIQLLACCIHGDMHRSQLHWHIQTSALYSSQIHSSLPGIKSIVSLLYLPCAWYRGQSDVMQHLMFILYGRMLPPAVDGTRGVPARALYKRRACEGDEYILWYDMTSMVITTPTSINRYIYMKILWNTTIEHQFTGPVHQSSDCR